MASSYVRLKWRCLETMFNKQDLYIILVFFTFLFIFVFCLVLKYDDPDPRYALAQDHESLVQEVLDDIKEQGPGHRLLVPRIDDPYREKEKFKRTKNKNGTLKFEQLVDKKATQPPNLIPVKEPVVNKEKTIPKDINYWLMKYQHVFPHLLNGRFKEKDKPPLLMGGKAHCTIYDHREKVREKYKCIKLDIETEPFICTYPSSIDIHLSKHLQEEGTWEPHVLQILLNKLEKDPDMGLIDIGANIGVYTLTAASAGHKVVAVEPYIENLKHLSKGIQLSHVEGKVQVIQNAIYDRRLDYMNLKLDKTNQGGIQIDEGNNFGCYDEDCPPQVKSIFMDDILEVVDFKSAIIKIDIEGHEHQAFRKSSKLFAQLYVPYIIMEWMKLREYYGTELTDTEDKDLVFELLDILKSEGYEAFSLVTGEKLIPEIWYSWPDDIIWKHALVGHV